MNFKPSAPSAKITVRPSFRKGRSFGIGSMSPKRKAQMALYIPARNAFLKANPRCQCGDCQQRAVDLHHLRGRAGSLLLDQRHWKSVCRKCHIWISENPKEARAIGMLCEIGKWNTPDRS